MATIYVRDNTELPARREYDYYATERSLIWAALTKYAPLEEPISILDPGAGDGRWGQAALKFYKGRGVLTGIELREEERPAGFDFWYAGRNFLGFNPAQKYDLIVGNPPYGPRVKGVPMAEWFVRKGYSMLSNARGHMIYLMRLSMLAGIQRSRGFWREFPPVDVAVVSRRPSFYGRSTNATDYAVYHWIKSEKPENIRLSFLYHEREWQDETS